MKPWITAALFVLFLPAFNPVVAHASVPYTVPATKAPANHDLVPIKPSGHYKRTTCLVSGETLGPDRLAYRYKGKEVQFCCNECVVKFMKNPSQYLSKP
ncbi:MAG TPA: hypothetical protein VGO93_21700 [Candidatus Xenobia bacterium]|jgi:hypothetical protein